MVNRQEVSLPPVDEVEDNGKSSLVANVLVFAQVSWFLVQIISRVAARMRITKVELLTAGYILMTLGIKVAWLDKPRNLSRPVRISGVPPTRTATRESWIARPLNQYMGFPDDYFDTTKTKRIPIFYSGIKKVRDASFAAHIALLFGCAFGGLMCVEWGYNSLDSSTIDVILWRLCAVEILQAYIFGFIASPYYYPNDTHYGYTAPKLFIQLASLWVMSFHILARITAIALAIKELRRPPMGTHTTLRWINNIPHI